MFIPDSLISMIQRMEQQAEEYAKKSNGHLEDK